MPEARRQEAREQEARRQDAGESRAQIFATCGPFHGRWYTAHGILYVPEGRRVAQGGTSSGSVDRCAGLMASATGCIPGPPSLPVQTARKDYTTKEDERENLRWIMDRVCPSIVGQPYYGVSLRPRPPSRVWPFRPRRKNRFYHGFAPGPPASDGLAHPPSALPLRDEKILPQEG